MNVQRFESSHSPSSWNAPRSNVGATQRSTTFFRLTSIQICMGLMSAVLILSGLTDRQCAAQHPADWLQGAGTSGNFRSDDSAPTKWSVVSDVNVKWKATLPETGQSTPVICAGKVFITTLQQVKEDWELGKNLVGWCFDANNGKVLWSREIPGEYPLRLSGCFGDSSSPPAVCNGKHVLFTSSSGTLACFEMDGNPVWTRRFLTVNRTLPFLHQGNVILTRQIYPPEPTGVFPHKYANAPKKDWTQLHAIDLATGKDVWTTQCGVNMGCAILPQRLNDGTAVAVVGRGGGHGPPEKPDGVSLVNLSDGTTRWTLPLEKFMATMSFPVRDNQVHLFHADDHLSIDATTGKVIETTSIIDSVPLRKRNQDVWTSETVSLKIGKNKRMITQTSNLLVGQWHYFRSYVAPWVGRVDVETGRVEYLELPLQLSRSTDGRETLHWYRKPQKKSDPPLKSQAIAENDMKNSRGIFVAGDKRSKGNGWGHVAAPTPSVAGAAIYIPVQNGTVYVLQWNAEKLDESAIIAINDLGPAGQAYTRASLSFAGKTAYAHTIKELICIGD